mgnify:CR=1 FL=1
MSMEITSNYSNYAANYTIAAISFPFIITVKPNTFLLPVSEITISISPIYFFALLFAGEVAGFLNPMGEGISAGMESGYCAAYAIMEHFDNPETVGEAYSRTPFCYPYQRLQYQYRPYISLRIILLFNKQS